MKAADRTPFGAGLQPQAFVPPDHPMRLVRRFINHQLERALDAGSPASGVARDPAALSTEAVARAWLLKCFYEIPSDRQLLQQLHYNLLFRWFVGFGLQDAIWPESLYAAEREKALDTPSVRSALLATLEMVELTQLIGDEQFALSRKGLLARMAELRGVTG